VIAGVLWIGVGDADSPPRPGPVVAASSVTGPWLAEPRVLEDRVVVPAGDHVRGVDTATGVEVWRSKPCGLADWAGPVEGPPGEVAAVLCAGELVGIHAVTGRMIWSAPLPVDDVDRVRNGPSSLLVNGSGISVVIDLEDGEELWRERTGEASVVADEERVYVADNVEVSARDLHTGTELWSIPYRANGIFADAEGVYARCTDQRLRRLDPDTGSIEWESEVVEDRLDSSEIVGVSEHTVVTLRTERTSQVTVFDRGTGELLWTYDAGADGPVFASTGGDTIVLSDMGRNQVAAYDDRTGRRVLKLGRPAALRATVDGDLIAHVHLDGAERRLTIVRRD
jgi:outer membrane protein assembly factor BamB